MCVFCGVSFLNNIQTTCKQTVFLYNTIRHESIWILVLLAFNSTMNKIYTHGILHILHIFPGGRNCSQSGHWGVGHPGALSSLGRRTTGQLFIIKEPYHLLENTKQDSYLSSKSLIISWSKQKQLFIINEPYDIWRYYHSLPNIYKQCL